jgi:hypothetical protein
MTPDKYDLLVVTVPLPSQPGNFQEARVAELMHRHVLDHRQNRK